MNINVIKGLDLTKSLSNSKFIISSVLEKMSEDIRKELVENLLKHNDLNHVVSVKPADSDSKFLAVIGNSSFCISYYQAFSDPDKTIKYLKKKLKG